MLKARFLAGKPAIAVLVAAFLGLALGACSSGVSQSKLDDANKQIADRERQQQQMQQQRTTAQNAINSASMLVGALTANSTAAQVQAANAAVTAATAAVTAATSLSETERAGLTSQLNRIRANLASVTAMRDAAMERMAAQKTAAENALNAAQMAVDALSDGSSDAQVMAAAEALAAASAAIDAATSLSAADMQALRNRLAMITTNRDNRVGNRQMASQRMAANDALAAANTAVNGVTNSSSDADVQAADDAVAAAASAVAAATSLSSADMQALADRLATIRGNLASAKYRRQVAMEDQERQEQNTEMADQRMAAQNALNAARMAVNALMPTSSDADAMAAAGLISAAETAVNAATSLSRSEQDGLKTQLANIEANLARTNMTRGELMMARTATNTAATDAGTAATGAEGDATAAENALMNLATFQTADQKKAPADYEAADSTSVNSRFHAAQARDHATMARKYAGRADDEKENADEAMTVAAAQAAQRAAEAAKMKADEYRTKAMQEMDKAAAAAKMEVMVDGNKYSVGDSMVVDDGRTRTTGSGTTGLGGRWRSFSVHDTGGRPTSTSPYRQAVYARGVETARIYDSTDDMARLYLYDKYLGADDVNAAVDTNVPSATVNATVSAAAPLGAITHTGFNVTALKPAGMFVIANENQPGGTANALEHTDIVNGNLGGQVPAEPQQIYTYSRTPTGGGSTDVYYVRQVSITRNATTGDPQTIVYQYVDVEADHDGDGSGANATPQRKVTAKIPRAKLFDHVNYGAWVDLNKAGGANTSQMPASLGVGFVQKTAKGTRTGGDMPNFGSATYRGRYVGFARGASPTGNGTIRLIGASARLEANFASAGVTLILGHTATLTGKIEGDGFSGTTATPHAYTGMGIVSPPTLPQTGSYTGSFQGHFYGPRAVEAAGVFDFTSAGRKDGEFRGAFGVSQKGIKQPSLN